MELSFGLHTRRSFLPSHAHEARGSPLLLLYVVCVEHLVWRAATSHAHEPRRRFFACDTRRMDIRDERVI